MKCIIIFVIVCTLSFAQHEGGAVERLMAEEVKAIIRANPSMTVAAYTTKSDAVFALDVPQEETITDRVCAREADSNWKVKVRAEQIAHRALGHHSWARGGKPRCTGRRQFPVTGDNK